MIETFSFIRLGILVGGIAAVGFGVFLWSSHERKVGYDNAIAAIAAQDQRALSAADKARATVAACRASGGVWNVVDGVCDKPAG